MFRTEIWAISRLAKGAVVLVLAIAMGCDGSKRLFGPYVLDHRDTGTLTNCELGDVRSSHLVLYPDGTYDQIHEMTNGETSKLKGERWTYSGGVAHLKNFQLVMNGSLHMASVGADADLKADPVRPPILLIPSSHCYYTGPK